VRGRVKDDARRLLVPLAGALARMGISPDHITAAGLGMSFLAGLAAGYGRFTTAAVALTLSGICDMLDGAVARAGVTTRFGAFLDSSVDRLSELLLFAGFVAYFHRVDGSAFFSVLTVFALGGSFLISYTRARAEGLGIECKVGVMERPERFVLLILALCFGDPGLRTAMVLLPPLAFYTTWQRMAHVHRESRYL